jgi:FkbM family methyltransferase
MFKYSRLKYLRRRLFLDMRDRWFGGTYPMDGVSFSMPLGSHPSPRRAVLRGDYEANERQLIAAHLPPDLPAIELGGSYGIVSHAIRARLAPTATLVVVEANPALIPTCTANVALGGSPARTHVVQAALAYGNAQVRFKLTANVHTSHLVFDGSTGPDIVDVASVTLQSLRATHGITGPFSLICDIEGAELFLLRNDAAALADCAMVIMETHPGAYPAMGGTLDEVTLRLSDLGLDIFDRRSDVIAARRPSL